MSRVNTNWMLRRTSMGFCEAGEERLEFAPGSIRVDMDGVKRGKCPRCERLIGMASDGRMMPHKFQGKGA